jgi:hypothetical protein
MSKRKSKKYLKPRKKAALSFKTPWLNEKFETETIDPKMQKLLNGINP